MVLRLMDEQAADHHAVFGVSRRPARRKRGLFNSVLGVCSGHGPVGYLNKAVLPAAVAPLTTITTGLKDPVAEEGDSPGQRGREAAWLFAAYAQNQPRRPG